MVLMMNATTFIAATPISSLSDHDWRIIESAWSRGIDHVVEKRGSRWFAPESLKLRGGFLTKKECYSRITDIVLIEARRRSELA